MLEWETLIAALVVQAANIAAWIVRAIWRDRQKRLDQKYELTRREQELRWQTLAKGSKLVTTSMSTAGLE